MPALVGEDGGGAGTQPTDCVLLPQFVMRQGAPAHQRQELVQESGIPRWALASDNARIPSAGYLRTWEVLERRVGDADIAVRVAERYEIGELGLYDYLFSTAATLGSGLAVCGPYMGTISTNFRFDPGPEDEETIAFDVTLLHGEGRGRELAMQFALAAIFTRARLATGRAVNPVRVAFRQPAPVCHASLVEVFGTGAIDFGASADTVVFRAADLELPFLTADARLAAILQRYAATIPAPPVEATTWLDRMAAVLADALDRRSATLEAVAHALALSPRSLQRRLAEHDTSWRAELDRARRQRFEKATAGATLTRSEQAELLGYTDVRSARRATRRWT